MDEENDDLFLLFAQTYNRIGVLSILLFSLFSLRIYATWLWDSMYIPIISPVYGQGPIWSSSKESSNAILIHVTAGILCALLIVFQIDSPTRRANKSFHKWGGRAYALVGTLMVSSLRRLRQDVGQGPSEGPSVMLQYFVDTSSFFWLLFTYSAVVCAMLGWQRWHKRLVLMSIAVFAVPMAQRAVLFMFIFPAVLTLVSLEQMLMHGRPVWAAELNGVPVLSLDGYGMIEHVSFPWSAWGGLLLVLAWGSIAQRKAQDIELLGWKTLFDFKGLELSSNAEKITTWYNWSRRFLPTVLHSFVLVVFLAVLAGPLYFILLFFTALSLVSIHIVYMLFVILLSAFLLLLQKIFR